MNCRIIRSNRKTIGLEVTAEGLIVRAPRQASGAEIDGFLRRHESWIEKKLAEAEKRKQAADRLGPISAEELRALADRAARVIPERVRYYAPQIGVTYGRITIRNQRTRWGSCSSKGDLNFNCLLMLTPPGALDSVVVHELCHRKVMDHSDRFYAEVLRVFPDYWVWHRWLRDNGGVLLARMKK